MNSLIAVVFSIVVFGSGIAVGVDDPSYYIKKDTWHETMFASRLAVAEFEAKQARLQRVRLEQIGIELGPWYLAGPFSSPNKDPFGVEFGPEKEIDLQKAYVDGSVKWTRMPQWKQGEIYTLPGHSPVEGKIVANYLYRVIDVSREGKVSVYLGSNDGLQVWLNGKKLLSNDVGRSAAPDQDIVELSLRRGTNQFLMKVNNRKRSHAFYFSMYPGGGLGTRGRDELWKLVRRDFASAERRILWEYEDGIWDKPETVDAESLARAYSQSVRNIEKLVKAAPNLARSVKEYQQLEELRLLYYRSRLIDEAIKGAEEKLRLVTGQYKYLSTRFKTVKGDSKWDQYAMHLSSLRNRARSAISRAGSGEQKVLDELAQIEDALAKAYKSRLPKVPAPSKSSGCNAFDLKQVRLLDGPFKRAMELDLKYLYGLDSDRLLHMFRVTAGLESLAKPLGGWEERGLRGHTMGHYLTACAFMYSSTADEKIKAKADAIVTGLAKCQQAFGNGYLGAFPDEGITKVIYSTGGWWAPWYTYHKIVAGMIDMYVHCGNEQALKVAEGMAAWAKMHLDKIDELQTQRMLEVEFGGMNEVFCNLYAITKDPDHLALARKFDHKKVFEPLENFQDKMTGLHVNTQIPKIVGAACEFELTGDASYYNISTFFWDQVVSARSYCTGGTSNHEHWRTEPYKLAEELSPVTQETCCTYNMLKLTRHLLCWNPDARYGDYYERALYNSILSTQDPKTGMMMYHVPLASGYWKIYNTPNNSFWCCTGTGLENHAKYGDSIYFYDDDGLYVNLFIASDLNWPQRRVRIRQETNFPQEDKTILILRMDKPVEMAVRIRVAYWTFDGIEVRINGKKQNVEAQAGTFLTLKQRWYDGDRIEIEMPMSLHLHPMPDDAQLAAIMYGPLVLAGRLGTEGYEPDTVYAENQGILRNYEAPEGPKLSGKKDALDSWIKPVEGKSLTFRTVNAGRPDDVTLVPYHKLFDQRYAIYWRFERDDSGK